MSMAEDEGPVSGSREETPEAVLQSFIEHLRRKQRPALATVVKTDRGGPAPGAKMIVLPRRTTEGSLGAISAPVTGASLRVLAGEDPPGVYTFDGVEVYIEAGCSPMKLVIAGAGHIGWNLARMAGLLGFEVTVLDDRPSFANRERFPDADNVIAGDFVETLSGMPIDDHTSIVLVTRGHRHDEACLKAVLRSSAAYIGMIGSRRRVRTVLSRLMSDGFTEAEVARVRAPIGLDIGAESPAEIALSILAEIIAVSRGATGRSLTDLNGRGKQRHPSQLQGTAVRRRGGRHAGCDFLPEASEALAAGRAFALATVVGTRGSTPRKTGARMMITETGELQGTIGGGCGEAEVWQRAMRVIADNAPALMLVDLTEDAEGEDRICGGTMQVFIEPLHCRR